MALLDLLTAYPAPLVQDEEGTIRIRQTRVTLDTVVIAYHQGACPEEIVLKFPSLDLTDVYAIITYYRWHRVEVDAYLEQRKHQAQELREQMEAQFPSQGVREQLAGRRAGGS